MAVSESSGSPAEPLHLPTARAAGAVSLAVSLAGLAFAIAYLIVADGLGPVGAAAVVCELVLLGVMTTAGMALLLGRPWAQRVLLGFWLAVAVVALVALVGDLLGGAVSWWVRLPADADKALDSAGKPLPLWGIWPPPGALAVTLVVTIATVWLVMAASAEATRLRYASMATVAIGAAAAVVLVVNMIAQKDYVRRTVETLGRYSLSDRSRQVLKKAKAPIRATCVYASSDKKDRSAELRPRVWELLGEMAEAGADVEIVNVTNDRDKQRLFERFRAQAAERAKGHGALLKRFLKESPGIVEQAGAQEKQWDRLAGRSYLDQWGIPTQVAEVLKALGRDWKKATKDVKAESAGMPDYPKLVGRIKELLEGSRNHLGGIAGFLADIGGLPEAVRAGRKAAMERLEAARKAVGAIQKIAGASDDATPPKDPAGVLKKLLPVIDAGMEACDAAAAALEFVAGKDLAKYVVQSRAWSVQLSRSQVIEVAGMQMYGRSTPSGVFQSVGRMILPRLKDSIEGNLRVAKTDFQAKTVLGLRRGLAEVATLLDAGKAGAAAALDKLAEIDKPTAAVMKSKALDEGVGKAAKELLDAARELPELKTGAFADEISRPNIVIVEVGAQAPQVVTFDEVWPLKVRRFMGPRDDEPEPRTFNGDSAIGSKILSMTQEPFATVILTYLDTTPPQPGRPPRPQGGPFAAGGYTALRRRLEEAELKVKEWDLKGDFPADANSEPTDPSQQVLLVLPPPPFMPPNPFTRAPGSQIRFGPEHVEKIRKAIDGGTRAIFLAMYLTNPMFGGPRPYPLNEYLKGGWGVDVRTGYYVIPAIRAESEPGKYNLSATRFSHLPLNTFAEHKICAPLQGQRTLWTAICPVMRAPETPAGVTVEKLLEIPSTWDDTWATPDVERVIRQFRTDESSFVSPTPADLRPPLDVALAAVRAGDDGRGVKPSRIVVLGVGAGLIDGYLNEGVFEVDRVVKLSDPPHANADLVINSAYWLCGRDSYIAAGPARIKPVQNVGRGTLRVLWILCVVALPLIVLGCGGVVLLLRRR